jgi:hypothetical protein
MTMAKEMARVFGHAALLPLERILQDRATDAIAPPIFIIGPPRSGTTLAYEAMISAYRLAFISNAAHRFFRAPLAATWLFRRAIGQWTGEYTSRFGHIDGWSAPSEGGWVGRRWLSDGEWIGEGAPDAATTAALRRLTGALSAILGAPFVNKNVMHSNRLRIMHHIWPEARYIVVVRDPLDNARSIVRAFRDGGGPQVGAGAWRSVRPSIAPQWEHRSLPARAVAQVIGVHADIDRDSQVVGVERFKRISYADLCDRPRDVLDEVGRFLDATGGRPERRDERLPARFRSSTSRLLTEDLEREMRDALCELGCAPDALRSAAS